MNASGYADLIAKIPAGADWIVADALGIEPIHQQAWSLVQPNLRAWVDNPEGIRNNDRDTLIMLMEGLIMSGLAMQVAQSSRPASGADHLFSHLWDNEHHVHNGIAPSHGVKVGIGAICSEALYEYILRLKAEDIRYDARSVAERWPSWESVKSHVAESFTDPLLAQQATAQCEGKYVDAAALSARLERLHSIWEDLQAALRNQLIGAETIQDMIRRAGAASTPVEIGIDYPRLHRSFESARLLRQRHTVLDLAFEIGAWDKGIDSLFGPGGFWRKE
jgi:glycerol-1-phosphate dehydrogenase [NAD(P)+]